MMFAKLLSFHFGLMLATSTAFAQAPTPVVVQAIPPSPAVISAQGQPVEPGASALVVLKILQELKATNADILAKQAATLQQLDEIQKAAEQLKIYSKRG